MALRGKENEILVLKVNYTDDDGTEKYIYPAILSDSREKVLVDCGYQGFLPNLEETAHRKGFDFKDLTSVIITHHDHDHYGGLFELLEKYPSVRVISSDLDAPYIEGREKSLRLAQAEAIHETLPESARAEAEKFQNALRALKPVRVDMKVKDGDVFQWCGGTEIIATPGHMPGHISLYVRRKRTLITGDTLVAVNGRLRIANPSYAIDLDEAKASVRKLGKYDIVKFVCYHGGVVETGSGDDFLHCSAFVSNFPFYKSKP